MNESTALPTPIPETLKEAHESHPEIYEGKSLCVAPVAAFKKAVMQWDDRDNRGDENFFWIKITEVQVKMWSGPMSSGST